jgi:hypothetical protein
MGAAARAVRILYFDKTPEMNWAVPWHQDRTIAVTDRVDVAGFAPWSVKGGIHHVEPPEAILRGMVALRLHLDDCGVDNGPLMAVRGSFRLGRVPATQIRRHADTGSIHVCCARRRRPRRHARPDHTRLAARVPTWTPTRAPHRFQYGSPAGRAAMALT